MTINASITASKTDEDAITWDHDGECKDDEHARTVCEGMFIQKCDDVNELVAALRAVYAIAGEDPQVRKIVEDAINEHGGPNAA